MTHRLHLLAADGGVPAVAHQDRRQQFDPFNGVQPPHGFLKQAARGPETMELLGTLVGGQRPEAAP